MDYTETEFIKINRKILLWRWFSDPCTRDVFFYCILKANWKPGSWRGIDYDRGEFVTSLSSMMKDLNLSSKNIRTAIDHLKSTGEITDRISHKYRVICVCNYDKYQSNPQAGSQELANAVIPTLSENENQTAGKMPAGCFDNNDTFGSEKSKKSAGCPARYEEPESLETPTFFERESSKDGKMPGSLSARCRQDTGKIAATDKEDKNIRTKEDKNNIYIVGIVDYLNKKANTNYRHNSRNTVALINARLKEGYTTDDFKKVIDKKCTDWLYDKQMCNYLRPETLFGTKFESYLNSAGNTLDRSQPSSYIRDDDTEKFLQTYAKAD